jgi:GT2 family glycosyltransferase/glycosyltransferase involved in cell wall biosynthesis
VNVTLITVSYNATESIVKLLESLKAQTDPGFSVIVVDNSSADQAKLREIVTSYGFQFIAQDNLGFAGGNNPALAQAFSAGADWAVLINPDTHVEPDFMARLKTMLEAKSGIVGLPLEEHGQVAYGGKLEWLAPTMPHTHQPITTEDAELYYPIGGGLVISKKAYETIGGLDQEYFLYFEDADYAMKARELEVPVEFALFPVIHHQVSQTTKKLGSPMLLRYHYRNALHFNTKRASLVVKILAWFWSLEIVVKQVFKIITGRNPEESRAILDGVLDFYQGRLGKIQGKKICIGIECENIEDPKSRWGVGKLTLNLIEQYIKNPEFRERYELTLYFKNQIPDDEILKDPILIKKIMGTESFNIFYHILLPLRAQRDRLDWMFFPAYMLPPLYLGKSIVMLTGDVYHEYKSGKLPFRYRLAYGLFTNWAAKFATKVMAISETSKQEVAQLYKIKPERIFVAHLGVEEPLTGTSNENGDYMLYVGQMFPRRHALESIRAFAKIAPEMSNLKFILVGRDKYPSPVIDKEIKHINQKLGADRILHYDYLERDEDVKRLYAHAKLFVYISSNEAFGLPPVEAASYGVPVVVKDAGINRELFGEAAFYVENEKKVEEIAAVFKKGLTDTAARETMIAEYRHRIPKLSWQNFAQAFFNHLS